MFSKDIVGKRQFLEMPPSSRALYYQLGIEADDDGFIDPYITMLATKSQADDLKILEAKGFVIPFEGGILVITHWQQHNYIRKDTYTITQYKEELAQLKTGSNNEYYLLSTPRQRYVNAPSPQDRIGKDRIGKDRDTEAESKSVKQLKEEKKRQNALTVLGWFNQAMGTSFKSIKGFEDNLDYWLEEYTQDDIKQAILNIKYGKWWAKDPSPTLLFRKKTPKGEVADYIGSLLNGGVNND